MDRRTIGSWLSGPREAAQQAGVDLGYRGQRLGLPESGPGSIARPGRRIAALLVDWLLCELIAAGFLGLHSTRLGAGTLAVFALENLVLVGTLGFTVGKRILRLRVIGVRTGRPPTLPAVVVRTLLLCLAVPALVWDRDGRGLHDRLAGTMVVRF